MGRKVKAGVDFFPLVTSLFSDESFSVFFTRYGAQATHVWIRLLCDIYSNGYYLEWTNKRCVAYALQIGITKELMQEMIDTLISLEMLDDEMYKKHQILTSKSIQECFQNIAKRRKNNGLDEYCLLVDNFSESNINVDINTISADINGIYVDKSTQSKSKSKSKSTTKKESVKKKGFSEPKFSGTTKEVVVAVCQFIDSTLDGQNIMPLLSRNKSIPRITDLAQMRWLLEKRKRLYSDELFLEAVQIDQFNQPTEKQSACIERIEESEKAVCPVCGEKLNESDFIARSNPKGLFTSVSNFEQYGFNVTETKKIDLQAVCRNKKCKNNLQEVIATKLKENK